MSERSVMERKGAVRWTGVAGRETRAPRAWPLFMTARVAADYCDTSPWTIRRHVEPCARRGRNFIYSIESVEAWMRGDAVMLRPNEASTPRSKPRAGRASAQRTRFRDLAKGDRGRAVVEEHEGDVAA